MANEASETRQARQTNRATQLEMDLATAMVMTSPTKRNVEAVHTETTARFDRGGNWVDAVVTLVATVLFGLSWTLVELERAEPFETGYAAPTSWEGADAPVPRVDGSDGTYGVDAREAPSPWIELAQRTSRR